MECQIEAASWIAWTVRPPLACWGMEGLPDMLDEGDLDEYARDHDEYIGPREYAYNGNNIRYKWRNRGPNHSRYSVYMNYTNNEEKRFALIHIILIL